MGEFLEVLGVSYEQLFCQRVWLYHWKACLFAFFNCCSKALWSSLTWMKMPQWAAAISLHAVLSALYCFPPTLDWNLYCRNGSSSKWLLILFSSISIFLVLQKWLYGFFLFFINGHFDFAELTSSAWSPSYFLASFPYACVVHKLPYAISNDEAAT